MADKIPRSSGFYDGHMAVEFYKGTWILRTRLATDRPVSEDSQAGAAMHEWRERNRRKFASLQ